MPEFDAYLMVDWSASSRPTIGADSIWYCLMVRAGTALHVAALENPSTRVTAMAQISNLLCGLARQGQCWSGSTFRLDTQPASWMHLDWNVIVHGSKCGANSRAASATGQITATIVSLLPAS